jgi:hypothetical protein
VGSGKTDFLSNLADGTSPFCCVDAKCCSVGRANHAYGGQATNPQHSAFHPSSFRDFGGQVVKTMADKKVGGFRIWLKRIIGVHKFGDSAGFAIVIDAGEDA